MALSEGARLVPVLALGEIDSMRNAADWPAWQRRAYKLFGFPFPFLLVGKYGLLPLPARRPLRVLVGKPLDPPDGADRIERGGDVPPEMVALYLERYYAAMRDLWERNVPSFPLYKDAELRFA